MFYSVLISGRISTLRTEPPSSATVQRFNKTTYLGRSGGPTFRVLSQEPSGLSHESGRVNFMLEPDSSPRQAMEEN